MFKRKSAMRRETKERLREGNGVTVFEHVLEKTELLGNCRLFAKITLEPGASIGYHPHEEEEEVYYILSGVATINTNGETQTVYPGEATYAGNGDGHSIANDGQEPLELLAVVLTYQPPER